MFCISLLLLLILDLLILDFIHLCLEIGQ